MNASIRVIRFATLSAAVALFLGGTSLAETDAGASKVVIGIPLPQAQSDQGAENAESLRQSLIARLQDPGVEIVPLAGATPEQLDAEARSRNCQYVLFTQVQQKHGGGGLLGKLAPLAGALPFAAGMRGGGGMTNMLAQAATQAATRSASNAAQEQMAAQVTGSAQAAIKRGDTLNLQYRLMAVGSSTPLKSATFSAKADTDGQDLLTQVAGQLADAVKIATHGGTGVPEGPSGRTDADESGHTGFMHGLFGRHGHETSGSTQQASAQSGTPDCARIASMPSAGMSFESCQKMLGAQQAYNQALADPSASRPGDEQMSCQQIIAELHQQQMSAPDKAKTAEFQSSVAQEQALLKRHEAESLKAQAEEQAKVDAGAAVDTAAEMATFGAVRPNAAAAAAEAAQARARVEGARMAAERRPTEQKLSSGAADMASGMGQQLTANPRLARLIQLADTHHCKGG